MHLPVMHELISRMLAEDITILRARQRAYEDAMAEYLEAKMRVDHTLAMAEIISRDYELEMSQRLPPPIVHSDPNL